MIKLAAQYVDPGEFDQKSWWKPVRPGVQWFYHSPRKLKSTYPEDLNPVDLYSLDIKTVDLPLRPLVSMCVKLNIITLPSCAGHDVSQAYSKRLYAQLKEDADVIPTKGLIFENVEDRQQLIYKDKNYELPWTHWIDLHAHLELYERMGVIGFRKKRGHEHNYVLFMNALVNTLPNAVVSAVVSAPSKLGQSGGQVDFIQPQDVELKQADSDTVQLWVSCATIQAQNKVWHEITKLVSQELSHVL